MLKKLSFNLLCLIHILIWIFVLLAFTNKKTAYYNLYIVIPLIYIVHILPFHLLIYAKQNIYHTSWENKEKNFIKQFFILDSFINLQKKLENKTLFSPISPQGMMIFGLISSAYSLNSNALNDIIKLIKKIM